MKKFDISGDYTEEIENTAEITITEEKTNQPLSNREMQFKKLLEASHAAREIKEQFIENAKSMEQAAYYQNLPLNYFLLNYIYKLQSEEITEFKKFSEWKKEGATVKKGEKAFPIWGQPVGKQKEQEAQSKGEDYQGDSQEMKRFPMCYVFADTQVIPKGERGSHDH